MSDQSNNPDPTPNETKKSPLDYFFDWLLSIGNWFKRFSTINEDDHWLMVVLKVSLRIIGILILLVLSPFILLALLLAFLLAGCL